MIMIFSFIIFVLEILLSADPVVLRMCYRSWQHWVKCLINDLKIQNLCRAHEPDPRVLPKNFILHATLFCVTMNLILSVNVYSGILVLLTFCVNCGACMRN